MTVSKRTINKRRREFIAAYKHGAIEEKVFNTLFRKPERGEAVVKLSVIDIWEEMKKADCEAMRHIKISKIWDLMKALDFSKKHYEDGNKYDVVRK